MRPYQFWPADRWILQRSSSDRIGASVAVIPATWMAHVIQSPTRHGWMQLDFTNNQIKVYTANALPALATVPSGERIERISSSRKAIEPRVYADEPINRRDAQFNCLHAICVHACKLGFREFPDLYWPARTI